ncbi:MAG: biopolymer transporter ExbD [bacterium]|nr:biopolymer transporter ExbD [bacterium]
MLRNRFNRKRTGKRKVYNEINMTPILDMTFLLLIAFIITFPALQNGITVNLPQGKADPVPVQKEPITLSVKAGSIYLNKDIISDEELSLKLAEAFKKDPDLSVLLRGDEAESYGRIMDVIKILNRLNIKKISFITETK